MTLQAAEWWAAEAVNDRVTRCILLNGTSSLRRSLALTMARIVAESGAQGIALGWEDTFGDTMYPVITVERDAGSWSVSGGSGFAWRLDREERRRFCLRVRGANRSVKHHLPELLWSIAGRMSQYVDERASPKLPDVSDPIGWLIAGLAGYQDIGFLLAPHNTDFFSRRLVARARELEPGPIREAYEWVGVSFVGDRSMVGMALRDLGGALHDEGRFADAAPILEVAYELAVATADVGSGARAALWLARALRRLTRFEEALCWYDLTSELALYEGMLSEVSIAFNGKATVFLDRGNLPRAEDYFREGLAVGIAAGDRDAIGRAHHGIMVVAAKMKEPLRASEHGLAAARYYDDPERKSRVLTSAGTLAWEDGDLDLAELAYVAAERLATKPEGRTFALLGRTYLAALHGNRELFLELYSGVQSNFDRCSPSLRVQALLYYGKGLEVLGHHGSKTALENAREVAEAAGLNKYYFEAEEELSALPVASETSPEPDARRMANRIRAGLKELVS